MIEMQIRKITKEFKMGEVVIPVLHGIDLDIYKGDLSIILGSSGSGKSTLLNLIGGLDRPTSGSILFDDVDITKFSEKELTEYRRLHIGFVFQFYNLVPTLTARENVQVATEIVDDAMDAKEALDHVGLVDYQDHFPSQLSGGQQQRVAIARAIAKKPRIMLCDEPTGALDSKTGQMVLKVLQSLNENLNTTILIITHAQQITMMANHSIYLKNGIVDSIKTNTNKICATKIDW